MKSYFFSIISVLVPGFGFGFGSGYLMICISVFRLYLYNEMPVIALDKFAEYAINYNNNDKFKITLSALNLPNCPLKMCSICNKEGHLERECPQDFLLELEVLPETTLNWKEILDKVCRHIMSKKY